jgi:hypothetical protein
MIPQFLDRNEWQKPHEKRGFLFISLLCQLDVVSAVRLQGGSGNSVVPAPDVFRDFHNMADLGPLLVFGQVIAFFR